MLDISKKKYKITFIDSDILIVNDSDYVLILLNQLSCILKTVFCHKFKVMSK